MASTLRHIVGNLADATRDLPDGDATRIVRQRLVDVIRQLEAQHLIPQANWNLRPRCSDHRTACLVAGDASDGLDPIGESPE
jgi:hypothetical protein